MIRKGLNWSGSPRKTGQRVPGITSISILTRNPEKPQGLSGFLILKILSCALLGPRVTSFYTHFNLQGAL